MGRRDRAGARQSRAVSRRHSLPASYQPDSTCLPAVPAAYAARYARTKCHACLPILPSSLLRFLRAQMPKSHTQEAASCRFREIEMETYTYREGREEEESI